uniref:Uncharacterized protein n=1 Tax=Amphimedon queenslandica TaxID=400682 RepID=A0A1X7U356_AMPQE
LSLSFSQKHQSKLQKHAMYCDLETLQWNLKYFMTNYFEAEDLALKSAFHNIKVFLCDCHRAQALER